MAVRTHVIVAFIVGVDAGCGIVAWLSGAWQAAATTFILAVALVIVVSLCGNYTVTIEGDDDP